MRRRSSQFSSAPMDTLPYTYILSYQYTNSTEFRLLFESNLLPRLVENNLYDKYTLLFYHCSDERQLFDKLSLSWPSSLLSGHLLSSCFLFSCCFGFSLRLTRYWFFLLSFVKLCL